MGITSSEIIERFEIMDKSITKALATGNAEDLYNFNVQSGELERLIPEFKGHFHCPKHLEYLIDHLKWKAIWNFENRYNYRIDGYLRVNDNF